jgi:hypothetical protein
MERFKVHLRLVLIVFITLGVAHLVNSAGAGNSAGGTDVPPEGGFANPLPGASTGPTTGDQDDAKATKGTVEDRTKSEPGTPPQDSVSPRKAPSSHADKQPSSDPVDPTNRKGLGKERH